MPNSGNAKKIICAGSMAISDAESLAPFVINLVGKLCPAWAVSGMAVFGPEQPTVDIGPPSASVKRVITHPNANLAQDGFVLSIQTERDQWIF
jgi:hypothetical protein